MTRTVRDAALLLSVIAGPDERDLLSLPADPTDHGVTTYDAWRSLTPRRTLLLIEKP